MALKKGNGLPKRGNSLPSLPTDPGALAYERTISDALRRELGDARYNAKTLMRWTGVSARTAKHWLAGTAGPSGLHLILMRNSDSMFETVLQLAGRTNCTVPGAIADARARLIEVRTLLDIAIEISSRNLNTQSNEIAQPTQDETG